MFFLNCPVECQSFLNTDPIGYIKRIDLAPFDNNLAIQFLGDLKNKSFLLSAEGLEELTLSFPEVYESVPLAQGLQLSLERFGRGIRWIDEKNEATGISLVAASQRSQIRVEAVWTEDFLTSVHVLFCGKEVGIRLHSIEVNAEDSAVEHDWKKTFSMRASELAQ